MRRFFVLPGSVTDDHAILDQEESHHLVRVLRLQRGETVELFDGTGALYTAKIEQLGKQVEVSLESKQQPVEGKQAGVTLCQGELKGGKMDFLVEKCTELGVRRFVPFSAGRSQGRLDDKRLRQRQQRRMSIVKKACKQSGRLRFRRVAEEVNFDELLRLDFDSSQRKIFLWEKAEDSTLAEAIGKDRESSVCLMIGPEGGFSDEEAVQALASGWQQVCLGDQILRAETAAISAVAIVNHLLGRM